MKNQCNYTKLHELVCQLTDAFYKDEIPGHLSSGLWELTTDLSQSQNGNDILSMELRHDGVPYLSMVSPDREGELYSFTVKACGKDLTVRETATVMCYLLEDLNEAGVVFNPERFQQYSSVLCAEALGNVKIPFNEMDFQRLSLRSDSDAAFAEFSLCETKFAGVYPEYRAGVFFYDSIMEPAKLLSASQAEEKLNELLRGFALTCTVSNDRDNSYPVENGKVITNDYWQRKFHFEHTLPDGNIYKGFINVDAPSEAELPSLSDIKGTFWAERKPEGWYGDYELEGIQKNCDGVITTGVYHPEVTAKMYPQTRNEIEALLQGIQPVKYEEIPRFEGRLEKCLTSAETHHWQTEYKSAYKPKKPKTMDRENG